MIKSNEYKAFLRIIHLLVYISAVCLHIYSKYFILWYMVNGTLHKNNEKSNNLFIVDVKSFIKNNEANCLIHDVTCTQLKIKRHISQLLLSPAQHSTTSYL